MDHLDPAFAACAEPSSGSGRTPMDVLKIPVTIGEKIDNPELLNTNQGLHPSTEHLAALAGTF